MMNMCWVGGYKDLLGIFHATISRTLSTESDGRYAQPCSQQNSHKIAHITTGCQALDTVQTILFKYRVTTQFRQSLANVNKLIVLCLSARSLIELTIKMRDIMLTQYHDSCKSQNTTKFLFHFKVKWFYSADSIPRSNCRYIHDLTYNTKIKVESRSH